MTQKYFVGDGYDPVRDMKKAFSFAVRLAKQEKCKLLVKVSMLNQLRSSDYQQVLPENIFTSFVKRESILWDNVEVQLFDGKTKGHLYNRGVLCLRCGELTLEKVEHENVPLFIVTSPIAPNDLENWAQNAQRIETA